MKTSWSGTGFESKGFRLRVTVGGNVFGGRESEAALREGAG